MQEIGKRDELVDDLLRRMEERGVPQGAWLVDITHARASLRRAYEETDALLERLQEAVMRDYERHYERQPEEGS